TRVETTPGCLRIRSCMPQKQPPARMARWVVMVVLRAWHCARQLSSSSFPRKRESSDFRVVWKKALDSGSLPLRGLVRNDDQEQSGAFKQFTVLRVAFLFQIGDGNEAQRRGVDAVTHAAAVARTVIEHVAQVAVAVLRAHFGALHAVAGVVFLDHVGGFD